MMDQETYDAIVAQPPLRVSGDTCPSGTHERCCQRCDHDYPTPCVCIEMEVPDVRHG